MSNDGNEKGWNGFLHAPMPTQYSTFMPRPRTKFDLKKINLPQIRKLILYPID